MHRVLSLHPASRCEAVSRIEVEATRPAAGELALRYVMTGAINDLRLPEVTSPGRADELWRRTCFEAFVRPHPGPAYLEFNFAPSTQWAAYAFSDYRTGMREAREIAAPRIEVERTDTRCELRVCLRIDPAPATLSDAPLGDAAWRLGLCAVVEEAGGRQSYWGLVHPPGKPDFHHADAFGLDLAGAAFR
jgi:hypothetical protein